MSLALGAKRASGVTGAGARARLGGRNRTYEGTRVRPASAVRPPRLAGQGAGARANPGGATRPQRSGEARPVTVVTGHGGSG